MRNKSTIYRSHSTFSTQGSLGFHNLAWGQSVFLSFSCSEGRMINVLVLGIQLNVFLLDNANVEGQ